MTLKVCPAIVAVPFRSLPAFAAIVSCTAPLPEPLPPDAMPIHAALLVAFHEQPPGAVTETDTVPAPLPTV